jgi:hypothetical protein
MKFYGEQNLRGIKFKTLDKTKFYAADGAKFKHSKRQQDKF